MGATYHVFESAERVEVLCASIYRALADLFGEDPQVQQLFLRLEAEELQHASRIRLMALRYRHDSRRPREADPLDGPLEELLAEGQRVLGAIRRGEWTASLQAVKERLVALESRCAAAHAEVLARAVDPGLRDFFEQLARQDQAHQALLGP